MTVTSQDAQFLELALQVARGAADAGEVPVGAVVVKEGQVLATGANSPIRSQDPTAHAEINALRAAALRLGNYRLDGCDLYVTLEPCAMCAGAILHARIRRVVYAVPQPKTGAAGSVLNLFETRLNHQTQVDRVMDSAFKNKDFVQATDQLLPDFFAHRRKRLSQEVNQRDPLRPDALRTPDACFAHLPSGHFDPHYLSDLPSLEGLRMHYVDEGSRQAPLTYLCLHGNPTWSYLYRKMIPIFAASGARVVAPDMVGFGRSDKPKKVSFHRFSWHRQCLLEFVERLDLNNIVLVVQDWGGILGLTLPMAASQRYRGLLVMNTMLACGDAPLSDGLKVWKKICANRPEFEIAHLFSRDNPQLSRAECAAYSAPFPDAGHRAAIRAFALNVPASESCEGAAESRQAREYWRHQWHGQTLMAIGQQDRVFGDAPMRQLARQIQACGEPLWLPQAGHFVQEHGEPIAKRAVEFFKTSNLPMRGQVS